MSKRQLARRKRRRELYVYFSCSFVEEIGGCGANNIIAAPIWPFNNSKESLLFFPGETLFGSRWVKK